MNREEFIILADRVAGGTATEAELRRYNGYYNEYQMRQNSWGEISPVQRQQMLAAAKRGIDVQIGADRNDDLPNDRKQVRLWPRIAGIAAAVAAVVFGVWLYRFEIASEATQPRNDGMVVNDVAPGKYGATITLADGKVIQLDSAKRGVVVGGAAGVAYSDNTPVISNEERNLLNSEDKRSLGTRDDVVQLIATTAKGQTYSFTLPDGTKVWLNADSRLEFPTQFSGKERKILLQGEAYFAVVHDDKQPFRVVSKTPDGKAQVVEDIGTEFNINAYADESSVKTTLVEGAASVSSLLSTSPLLSGSSLRGGTTRQSTGEIASKAAHSRNDGMVGEIASKAAHSRNDGMVGEIASKAAHSRNDGKGALGMTGRSNDGKWVTLSPNQQATWQDGGIKVKKVDVEQEIAWKKGDFIFRNERLGDIMVQLSRWYNVEVSYADESLKDIQLGGFVSRSKNISAVLKMMKLTKRVDFQIKDRKIIVIPYKPIN